MRDRSPLVALTLATALLLPTSVAVAQTDTGASSPAPDTPTAVPDARVEELQALIPPALAGLPLGDNLQTATGEQLLSVMTTDEQALLEGLLEANGKTAADYAAAATWLPVSETQRAVIQAHRIEGVAAADTIDTWVEILSLNVVEPRVSDGFVAGRPVTIMADASLPEAPLLHLFPAGDVVWMMWADDEALVQDAMEQTEALTSGSEAEDGSE